MGSGSELCHDSPHLRPKPKSKKGFLSVACGCATPQFAAISHYPVCSLETNQNEPRRTTHLLLALHFRGSRPRCCATLDIKMLSFNGQNHVLDIRTVHMAGAIPITAAFLPALFSFVQDWHCMPGTRRDHMCYVLRLDRSGGRVSPHAFLSFD